MARNKFIGSIVHQGKQFLAFIDNRNPLPPGQNGGPKASDLNILFFDEKVRNGNRIVNDKPGIIVLLSLLVKKVF